MRISFRISSRLFKYFKENPSAIFIIGFQMLLISAAAFLISGDSVLANEVAVYSYYSLVMGVVLQLIAVVRKGPEERAA